VSGEAICVIVAECIYCKRLMPDMDGERLPFGWVFESGSPRSPFDWHMACCDCLARRDDSEQNTRDKP
jgi:hypothetical protein